jgi:hypothetical protein
VWEAVSAILKDSEQLRADLDTMIEMERGSVRGDAGEEARLWADKLTEVERKRARYQEMAASDLITFDELREKLGELAETRDTAERELEAIRDRSSRLEELERDRDAVLESLVDVAPQALDSLSPEERNRFYKMLRLEVVVSPDGSLEVSGAFGDGLGVCEREPLPWPSALASAGIWATISTSPCPTTLVSPGSEIATGLEPSAAFSRRS